ncbi:HMG-Y-related protein A-like [Lolium rigidum]|uniref:HMG-Y-related protein A-like n=1 Tax=Lolium rigidum TaxID=89674 RepID=UPI001F5C7211|nr:HMG-Y-related protein A-like [Lolium rigidum]
MANDDSPKSGDLPPYPEMILAAIEALDDKSGSNKTAISTYIEENYENLPPAHASLLTANLASMKEGGKLAFVKNNYLKPAATAAAADAAAAEPTPKRGRGRPRKDPSAPRPPPKEPKDPTAPKRGRGRPAKAKDPVAEAVAKATAGMPKSGRGRPAGKSPAPKKAKVVKEAPAADASGSAPAKRGRGRPPKAK